MAATDIPGENTAAIAANTQAIGDLEAALANERARAITAETTCSTYTDTKFAAAGQAISALETTLKAYADAKAAQMMKYKGQKSVISALPMTGNSIGDVWDVAENGHNYAWNGEAWDDLGGQIDTSMLVPLTTYNEHVASTAHITAAERTLWNSTLSVSVGTVTALSYGQNPVVTNSGTGRNAVLNFGIPAGRPFQYSDFTQDQLDALKGKKGDTGPAPTLSIGMVTIGDDQYDGDVTCTSTGAGSYAIGFKLPVGPKGDAFKYSDFTPQQLAALKGPKGDANKDIIVGNVSTLSPSSSAYVTVDASQSDGTKTVLNFGIPRGYSPYIYASTETLAAGEDARVQVTTTQSGSNTSCSIAFGIPRGDPGYIALQTISPDGGTYQLLDDTCNLINLTGSTTALNLRVPYEYRQTSRTAGAHEFTLVISAAADWSGTSLELNWKKRSSSDTCVFHYFDAHALSTTELAAGKILVMHFAEIYQDHYMVSSKVLSTTTTTVTNT